MQGFAQLEMTELMVTRSFLWSKRVRALLRVGVGESWRPSPVHGLPRHCQWHGRGLVASRRALRAGLEGRVIEWVWTGDLEMNGVGHVMVEVAERGDRRSRFQSSTDGSVSLRERAASQPPRTSDNAPFVSSPPTQHFVPSSISSGPWSNSRMLSPNRGQPIPIRSSSFSAHPPNPFASTGMRDRIFPSTFEDDESEALSDTYDERFVPASLARGRTYGQDPTRSRSQSLATGRPGPIGSPYTGASAMQSWNESYLSNSLSIPSEIKPPGSSSRYGTTGRSPTNMYSSSPSGGSFVGNGHSNRNQQADVSNMSPFVRDVGQILLDDGSAFRELWAGMHPPRDENGGGGSGTTSRRHSVSVVQPAGATSSAGFGGRSGLLLSDDDLAADLGLLNINPNEPPPSSSSQHPPSQPSSLPIYAPLSRSPPSRDLMSTYQSITSIFRGGSYSRSLSHAETHMARPQGPTTTQQAAATATQQSQQQELTAVYSWPRHPICNSQQQQQQQQQQGSLHQTTNAQYVRPARRPTRAQAASNRPSRPARAPSTRSSRRTTRKPAAALRRAAPPARAAHPTTPHHPPNLAELGKGVPLHTVPASWPLFIVEFKAGRTDLFYLTDLGQAVRVGDLVIVEADRGKDWGRWRSSSGSRRRRALGAAARGAGARMGAGSRRRRAPGAGEINPKMIYRKAGQQDLQLLATKTEDELKALQLCQTKVRAKKLPMEVIDAEYQWLTKAHFYFVAEKRIDFRELVRELFRLYKTRIWMASLQGGY
ncbi:PSP1 C-terminal conserved region-domain-containing protein [Pholiota molesta]|nr:PSP1 C-terminal conserved region-domain-containing protein [Pholiota molesta]